jgi:hypothetical protein
VRSGPGRIQTLRVEIGHFQSRILVICQSAFTVLLGLIGAAAVTINAAGGDRIAKSPLLIMFILVAVALLYFLLACLYAQSTNAINNAAAYIHQQLRPQMVLLADADVWNWERYLATCRGGLNDASRSRAVLYRLLEWCFPWLVFDMPMGLCALLFVLLHGVLLTSAVGWSCLAFVALLVALAVYIAAATRGGRGVVNERQTGMRG